MRVFMPTLGDKVRLADSRPFLDYLASAGFEVILVSERPLPPLPFGVMHLDIPSKYDTIERGAASYKRQWIENHLDPGEWAVSIDDGTRGFKGLDLFGKARPAGIVRSYSSFEWHANKPALGWARSFSSIVPWSTCSVYISDLLCEAKRAGTTFAGFTFLSAPMYRLKRYCYSGVVSSRLCIFKRDKDCGWMHRECVAFSHDVLKSLRVMRKYGCVVIDKWAQPSKKTYMPGGLGTFEHRLPYVLAENNLYYREFPELVVQHPKKPYMVKFKVRRGQPKPKKDGGPHDG